MATSTRIAGLVALMTLAAPSPGMINAARQTGNGPRIAVFECVPKNCKTKVGIPVTVRAEFSDLQDATVRWQWSVSRTRDGQYVPIKRGRARNEVTLRFMSLRPTVLYVELLLLDQDSNPARAYAVLEALEREDVPA